ncbi:hypothetical protein CDL12_02052 [Handroanthus impetiginosus]|uniref:Transcription repressor n=1 Tax=Handroanthus impetiginosus TaxID=429701 RepID=A0A2G9I623_9LAMI|nr:hypothetical protein CDL12_02052 [Handroanthus impetiginosus]
MSSSKKWNLKKIFTANGGCGCRPKATDIIEPKPTTKTTASDQKPGCYPSSSPSSWDRFTGGQPIVDDDDGYTSTTFSLTIDSSPQFCLENHDHSKAVSPYPKIQDSHAVVKYSENPYHDFRQSMLQMIFEKEIYSGDDLQQLLQCFLELNSPNHHEVIVKAFMEIWNGSVGTVAGRGEEEEAPPCSSSRDT